MPESCHFPISQTIQDIQRHVGTEQLRDAPTQCRGEAPRLPSAFDREPSAFDREQVVPESIHTLNITCLYLAAVVSGRETIRAEMEGFRL